MRGRAGGRAGRLAGGWHRVSFHGIDRLKVASAGLAAGILLAASAVCAPVHAAGDRPFVIAPVIEGLAACADRRVERNSWCEAHDGQLPVAVQALLDALEPGGAAGEVQLGYVLTVALLDLYRPDGSGSWRLDGRRIESLLDVIRQVPRPVVLYLAANHFDSSGPVTDALLRDPRNLMLMVDGRPPQLDYFGYRIAPYSLRTDESLPVNQLRFGALREVGKRVRALPAAVQERIVAITLAGEVHHLFADFAHGMGRYDGLQVTDYSTASQQAFRAWLARKYRTIDRLNAVTRERWRSFDEVNAPGADVWRHPRLPHGAHYDGHAGGRIPVAGWLWDPERKVQRLELRVNGRFAADVARGFNRLDVYRHVAAVTDPNVGFRHDLDFSRWEPGDYRLQLLAHTAQGIHEVARRRVVVEGARRSWLRTKWERWAARARQWWQGKVPPLAGVQVVLDTPRHDLQVLFNPLARDWNAFRSEQVTAFLAHVFAVARDAGLPPGKLYSHQILPHANSSWNAELFATDGSVGGALPWKQGFNTYGGAVAGEWIREFLKEGRITDYAVPEFHPQQWKRPGIHREALQLHRELGARFVSPYYLSIASDRERPARHQIEALEIRPNNPQDGSDALYRAIRDLAAQ